MSTREAPAPGRALSDLRACARMGVAPIRVAVKNGVHEFAMPLSEDEQRILREIEANLSASDPKLAQQVSDTTLYRHSARLIKWAALGFVAGLVLLLATFTSVLALGVVGFVVMLVCLLVIEGNVRKMGRAGLESLTGSLSGGALKGVFGEAGQRWRERWQRDDDAG